MRAIGVPCHQDMRSAHKIKVPMVIFNRLAKARVPQLLNFQDGNLGHGDNCCIGTFRAQVPEYVLGISISQVVLILLPQNLVAPDRIAFFIKLIIGRRTVAYGQLHFVLFDPGRRFPRLEVHDIDSSEGMQLDRFITSIVCTWHPHSTHVRPTTAPCKGVIQRSRGRISKHAVRLKSRTEAEMLDPTRCQRE